MQVKVKRNSFFRQAKGATLRFTETSPPEEDQHDHQLCNCTKNVCVRPDGEPEQVNQSLVIEQQMGDRRLSLEIYGGKIHINFYWPDAEAREKKAHAYFWHHPNPNRFQIEIIKPGYGGTGCFFGSLCFGNDIDISRLMNGHAPSRIIDLAKIGDDEVWAHECSWGTEAMATFDPTNAETGFWMELHKDCSQLEARLADKVADVSTPVDELRAVFEEDRELLDFAQARSSQLSDILDRLDDTVLFKCCDDVYCRTREVNSKS